MVGGIARLLKDKGGKGPRAGKKRIEDAIRLQIATKIVQEKPKNATHWTARMMAEEIAWGIRRCSASGRSMA